MNQTLPNTGKSGFSLIELLVVIGIISTLLLVGVSALISYYRIQTFNVGVAEVVTMLQTAKSYAQSQVKKQCPDGEFKGYSVAFTATTYVLDEVCTTGSKLVETKTIHKDLTISPPSSPIVFRALTGNVEPSGIILLTINGYNRQQIIKINTGGNIYVCPISPAPCR